ncbi:hydantoinase B/oxoprolinase family protein [Burkholderia sp. PU8-34]
MNSVRTFDPITLEIIQSSLQAISDEMFAALKKTAMSAIIYEVLDMGTAITDGDGNLASSGAGIPSFVGVLDKAVKKVLEIHGRDGVRPGDIFVTNDPYFGGVTHLNDVVLAMPVFVGDELVAWTSNIAHWNDVGGKAPGSFSPDATEIYQEGLRLPAVKLVDRGTPVNAVIEIMKANSRLPRFLEGDMWAGIASVRIGARRLEELAGKYGADTLVVAMQRFMDYGEVVSRAAMKNLPRGRFSFSEEQDNGLVYTATIEITDDEFIVDLTGNPDQDTGPNNTCRDGATIAAQMIFKNVTSPIGVTNGGTFRPLKVITRPGSVFDAQAPAAFGIYYEVEMRLYDVLWRCLAAHVSEYLPAGHFSSVCGTLISGPNPETGELFTIVEPQVGGWGGARFADGNSAMFSAHHGETFNCPAEVAEARYGLYVEQLSLNDEPGGEGRFRGGKGIVLDYRVRSDDTFLTCSYSRHKHVPWGIAGGRDGTPNYVEVIRADGTSERLAVANGKRLNSGDIVRVVTGNGGGYGDPGERADAAIAADLRDGYVRAERAREVYGSLGAADRDQHEHQ